MSVVTYSPGNLKIVWDPKNIKIKTWSVQRLLSPLINRVTTLIGSKPSNMKKGKSKNGDKLLKELVTAIEKFCYVGYEIALDNTEAKDEILDSIEEIKSTGDRMVKCSANFIKDPQSPILRADVAEAARPLLFAVTRLLIVADLVDVCKIVHSAKFAEKCLPVLRNTMSQEEFNASFKALMNHVNELNDLAKRRQLDLINVHEKERIAVLRAGLKQNMHMLNASGKANIRHPDVPASKEIREFAFNEISKDLHGVMNVSCNAVSPEVLLHNETFSDLNGLLDKFDLDIIINPNHFSETVARPKLEESLENIIRKVGLFIDFSYVRYERKHRIVQECNSLRQALQDLLSAYCQANNRCGIAEEVEAKIGTLRVKTSILRKQLRKAATEQISDVFISTNQPLIAMIDAAKEGDLNKVNECSTAFTNYASMIIEVSLFTSSLSSNVDAVKFIPFIIQQIRTLSPQVVNAAKILVLNTRSVPALEMMDLCRCSWEKYFKLLTETIDEISRIEDFMSISESLVLDDINDFIRALDKRDTRAMDKSSTFASIRSLRVAAVVSAEMDKYESCYYTNTVREAVRILKNEIIPNFIGCTRQTIEVLSAPHPPPHDIDKNEVISVSNMVYDGIRDIRCAVLMNPDLDLPTDSENEEDDTCGVHFSAAPSVSASTADVSPNNVFMNVGEHENFSREVMRKLPQEEMEQIEKHVQVLKKQKREFDREVLKWDEQGNDIIVLAKQMCVIMMEMSDFTRGKGSLRSTMDVIKAAKKISDCGVKLDILARKIASECVESQSKQDLLAYLDRISLFTHQLNITSRVKADVQNISGELVVSGLDSATSLITSAKNLMNSVVSVVKASYIASTKYRNRNRECGIQWHMKPPAKKSLFVADRNQELTAKIKSTETTNKGNSEISKIDLLASIR